MLIKFKETVSCIFANRYFLYLSTFSYLHFYSSAIPFNVNVTAMQWYNTHRKSGNKVSRKSLNLLPLWINDNVSSWSQFQNTTINHNRQNFYCFARQQTKTFCALYWNQKNLFPRIPVPRYLGFYILNAVKRHKGNS